MKKPRPAALISVLCSALLLCSPVAAVADPSDETSDSPQISTSVIITEMQTGNAARADEFIELYNATAEPVNLTGWQLRYVTASATSAKHVEDPSTVINLQPPLLDGGAVLLPPGGYFVLRSGAVTLPEGVIGQQYDGLLPATGGSLVLVSLDNLACEFVVQDAVAWGNTAHLFGEGEALVAGGGSADDRLYTRLVDADSNYVDAQNNITDFYGQAAASAASSPGAADAADVSQTPAVGSGAQSQTFPVRFPDPDCTLPPETDPPVTPPVTPPTDSPPSVTEPPQVDTDEGPQPPTIPVANIGLKAPLLSELLPNPASPQTDKNDEFIELYNPNDAAFDLSGYVLEVGLTAKKHYTIPEGASLPARAFVAFFSADTHLALSNTASQAALVDPLGTALATSTAYDTAKDGQSWVLANGSWQWTTKPTPNALNVVSALAVKKASAKKPVASTAAKTTASSGSQTKGLRTEGDVGQAVAVAEAKSTTLHPGVLAAVAVSAILYGAYEYRHDVANRFYQFRTNRAVRRAARQSAEGQRSH